MSVTAPRDLETFHLRLREVSSALPKRMRQCADFLAENTDRIAVSTVAELASGANVQPSAMMRFCQTLGFSGYSEMQQLFRNAYEPASLDYSARIQSLRKRGADTPASLLAEFLEAGQASLESLASTIDARRLDEAVTQLAAADTIHIAGFRRAFPIASYLAYAFEKMEISAVLHEGVGKLHGLNSLRKGDALLVISFAPYSQETIVMAQHAAEKEIPVIGITDLPSSPLHEGDVTTLSVREVDFGAFRSLAATLTLAISLAVSVGTRRAASE